MKTIMYIMLCVVILAGIVVYLYFGIFKRSAGHSNLITRPSTVVAYGQRFGDGFEGSRFDFPDFSIAYKGISKPTLLQRIDFQTVKHSGSDGPLPPSGNFLFEVLPQAKESKIWGKEIKVQDVPWGSNTFVVAGKTYTIEIAGLQFDNPQLPQFVVTEAEVEAKYQKDRVKNMIPTASTSSQKFAQVYHIDLDIAKVKYPDQEFFKPNTKDTSDVLELLATELVKEGYTTAEKRNIQLIGQIVNGKKQIYAFMWVVGSPLDKHDPEQNYLTNMISDGGSSFIDAVVNIDPMSDFHSVFIVSFDPHGES